MKEIKLTQGKVALVDDDDFEYLNQWKWHARKDCNTYYARRTKNRIPLYMHHDIIGKPIKGIVTDHIDGNGLNNQRYNLRHITHRQNGQNRHGKKTSQYVGVRLFRNKWESQITINGKSKYLGLFIKEKDAHEAYKKALDHLGESLI